MTRRRCRRIKATRAALTVPEVMTDAVRVRADARSANPLPRPCRASGQVDAREQGARALHRGRPALGRHREQAQCRARAVSCLFRLLVLRHVVPLERSTAEIWPG